MQCEWYVPHTVPERMGKNAPQRKMSDDKHKANPHGHFLEHSLHLPTVGLGNKANAKWHVQIQLPDLKQFYANTRISNTTNLYLLLV